MRNENGFTLIEIVISVAILAISLVTLISAFNRATYASAETSSLTQAVMLGGEKLSQAMDAAYPDEGKSDWAEDTRFPRFRYRKVVSSTPFTNVRLVQMEVQHDEKTVFSLQGYRIE